ncbi:MAG: hypothetical protein ABI759_04140 [Candidatus Solibacter sp.]
MSKEGARLGLKAAFALATLGYFLYFNLNSLWTRFAADDMMNMASYWRLKPLRMLLDPFMPWHGAYRPFAAFYYLPLLGTFGLNPLPFHAAMFALLLANVYLTYRFARLAGCGELPAGIAALLVSYHAGLSVVYYSTAFIYDVLCFTFFMGALLCYLGARSQGRLLRRGETALLLPLFLFALDSKEMALTLPLILVAYELIFHPLTSWKPADRLNWLRGPGRVVLYCAALNLVYLYGKAFGPDPMMASAAYRPQLSVHRFFAFEVAAMNDLFLSPDGFTWRGVVALWIVTGYLAFRRRRPVLRFSWAFLMLTPIPLALLEGRSGGCLYIPYAGWAVFTSVLLVDFAGAVARLLAGEPIFRLAGSRALLALVIGAALFCWARENHRQRQFVQVGMDDLGRVTGLTLDKMRALNPHVKPGSHVAFRHDPFPDWDMLFIGELWFRDRTLQFHLLNKVPLPPEELARMTVFDFQGDRIVQLTSDGLSRP